MKVADLSVPFKIELPKTDAIIYVDFENQKFDFIANYGNVDVVWKNGYYWSVPSFEAGRTKYMEAKAKDCAIWGCE